MDGLDSIRQTFFQECEDLLSDLESGLMLLQNGDANSDTIDSVFRAVHSIKGGAGAFNLTSLVSFSHTFENVLDDLRSDRLEGNSDIHDLLLQSSDMLHDIVDVVQNGEDWNEETSSDLLSQLEKISTKGNSETSESSETVSTENEDFGFKPMTLDLGLGLPATDPSPDEETVFEIEFKPNSEMFGKGHSVTRLIRHLQEFGPVDITCMTDDLPALDSLAPQTSYLSWKLSLTADVTEEEVHEVFDFVKDDCELVITRQTKHASPEGSIAGVNLGSTLPSLGGIELGSIGSAEPDEMTELNPLSQFENPAISEGSPDNSLPNLADIIATADRPDTINTPEADIDPNSVNKSENSGPSTSPQNTPARSEATADKSSKKAPQAKASSPTIRINLERVDKLINQVGELVINQAMLTQCVTVAGLSRDPTVLSTLDEFKQLTRDIQDSVMSIRAQPVQPLFQRMSRIVREAAQSTEKKVRLNVEGEFTEVDKTIIEKLADPLTHMIRNAVDHGLEKPEAREKAGKNAEGTVTLSAAHRSGKIVIQVRDDGAGINRAKVKKIAISKGLIPPEAELSNSEIDNLLFMPGFSTVDQVSTLSGRGVGMDVVKRSIQSFGGRILISSEPGKGSTFTINLPLTLAVLDGMLVEVTDQIILIPLTSIVETLLLKPEEVHNVTPQERVINVRGAFLPLIDLGEKLKFSRLKPIEKEQVVICIETEDAQKYAILVDGIQDQRQVVIKSLEDNYGSVPNIAAATILGDGRIALIADVDALVSDQDFDLMTPTETKALEPSYV
jgi:two-component system chemotaxis sensor kinase CheA